MKLYWIKTNRIIKSIFSKYTWDIPNTSNKIYLTFDDGPCPKVTKWVLNELKKNEIRATFFCIGKNIKKHPKIFTSILADGHAIGNHTQNHFNGWTTTTEQYVENTKLCHVTINDKTLQNSTLFRPPYGKIKKSQALEIKKLGYKIIMWDVLSADFDSNVSPENCLQNVLKNVQSGSIIVFHDSEKAAHNLRYALPKTIETLKQKGFIFDCIS